MISSYLAGQTSLWFRIASGVKNKLSLTPMLHRQTAWQWETYNLQSWVVFSWSMWKNKSIKTAPIRCKTTLWKRHVEDVLGKIKNRHARAHGPPERKMASSKIQSPEHPHLWTSTASSSGQRNTPQPTNTLSEHSTNEPQSSGRNAQAGGRRTHTTCTSTLPNTQMGHKHGNKEKRTRAAQKTDDKPKELSPHLTSGRTNKRPGLNTTYTRQ